MKTNTIRTMEEVLREMLNEYHDKYKNANNLWTAERTTELLSVAI